MLKVSVIGSGNVGFHFINLFHNSEKIQLCEWYSSKLKFDKRVTVINDISILSESDIYIICVNDDSISKISDRLKFRNRLVVHTSGSNSYKKINIKNRRGVFYPLQTFSKSRNLNYSEIPFCIEAEKNADRNLLINLTKRIGCKCYEIDFNQRKTLHLAAVITNNFTNFLFILAKELLNNKNLDFEILKPLIKETVNKIHKLEPENGQTGPAKRKDHNTINMHLKMLDEDKTRELYKIISEMITSKYEK